MTVNLYSEIQEKQLTLLKNLLSENLLSLLLFLDVCVVPLPCLQSPDSLYILHITVNFIQLRHHNVICGINGSCQNCVCMAGSLS